MNYLMTGGTGFIGRQLTKSLLSDGHSVVVVSRNPEKAIERLGGKVTAMTLADVSSLAPNSIDGVINLAGAPIVDKRWSDERKQEIKSSRIDFTTELIERLKSSAQQPACFISGSAIGYFGPHIDSVPLNEDGAVEIGFQHTLCEQWEAAALQAKDVLGARVCIVRTGLVLGAKGGALAKMLPPFKFGLGGPIGEGCQWMSWIHIDDEVGVIRFLMSHEHLSGAFNTTAPNAVTNTSFTKALASVLHRPAICRVPAVVLKLLMGESSELLLSGQHVYPKALVEAGYDFKYPDIEAALRASI